MKTKDVRGLVQSLIVDVDGAIAGDPRDEAARHSAAASAAILAVRLIGGGFVNLARIAAALEDIADKYCEEDDEQNP